MQGTEVVFPATKAASAKDYCAGYLGEMARAAATLDQERVVQAAALLEAALLRDATLYACGNGGSAAIANHLVCDHQKGIASHTHLCPRVVSLSSNIEIITAIANDLSYADVFAHQLKLAGRKGDVLVAISSSGNSENIVRALEWARENGLGTIAFTGFDGGRAAALADVNLHVASWNYGVVEDLHQACMHMLAQYLRQTALPDGLMGTLRF